MAAEVKQLPERKDIPVEDTWKLEDIFPSDDAWEKEFKEILADLPKGDQFRGKLGESGDTLWEAWQFQGMITERRERLYT